MPALPLDDQAPRRSVYLHPGQWLVGVEPTSVSTILGSCVSVCLFDARSGHGGMNHYLLPLWAGNGASSPRFGNVAVRVLLEGLLAAGAQRSALVAKVFGGACVIDAFRQREGRHLGQQNVARALEVLDGEGITVAAQDTGGNRGRKVLFHTDTGVAWVRSL